jgi:hypothetical protein
VLLLLQVHQAHQHLLGDVGQHRLVDALDLQQASGAELGSLAWR